MLSEARLFETMPNGQAIFVGIPEIRAAVQRALVSDAEDGAGIIAKLVVTAVELDDPPYGDGHRGPCQSDGDAPQRLLLTALRASVKGPPEAEQSPTKPATSLTLPSAA